MKKILFIAALFISNFCFSQARELTGRDTTNHRVGFIYKDTLKTIQADSPIVITTISPYLLKLSLSSGYSGGLWTASTLYPTKMYAGVGINTYTRVGIGIDTPRSKLSVEDNSLSNTTYDSLGIMTSNTKPATSGNQSYSPPIGGFGRGYRTTSPRSSVVGYYQYIVPIQGSASPSYRINIDGYAADAPNGAFWRNIASWGYNDALLTGNLSVGGFNIGVTPNQIDNGNGSSSLLLTNTSGGGGNNGGVQIKGFSYINYLNSSGALIDLVSSTKGFAVNDFASATYADASAIADFASTTKGILIPRMSTNKIDTLISAITSFTITNAGSSYTNGSYTAQVLTTSTGIGVGGKADITVAGGVITVATVRFGNQPIGNGFKVGDQLTVGTLGGTGSGGILTVASVTIVAKGLMIQDTSVNQLTVHNTGYSRTGRVITTAASTYSVDYGDDYIFTGSTSTFTLPAILTNTAGRQNAILITNLGSGSITLNTASGSVLYPSGSTTLGSSITIASGASAELLPTGIYFKTLYNQ
jgi:hypothetical protein